MKYEIFENILTNLKLVSQKSQKFYDLGLDTCWPKNSGQTDEVVDIVFDAYVSKWREMYGDDLTDDQADELYAMIYDGVF